MRYREIRPQGAARELIDCYWTLECEAESTGEQRIVPDGRPELIVNLGRPFESFQDGQWREQPQCFLVGQITGQLRLRPNGPAKILGVRFLPQGMGQVLRMPMPELTGRAVPVADLSPALAHAIDNARECESFAQIEAAVLSASGAGDQLAAEAVRQMVRARGVCSLARLAASLNISSRQLERRFARSVGVSPKLFCRIQRFQHVFQLIEEGRPNWATAALECGYYDQAHLIRDFTDFSGQTPAVLLGGDELARHFVCDPAMSDFYKTAASACR